MNYAERFALRLREPLLPIGPFYIEVHVPELTSLRDGWLIVENDQRRGFCDGYIASMMAEPSHPRLSVVHVTPDGEQRIIHIPALPARERPQSAGVSYPDAPRYIPATPELCNGWQGFGVVLVPGEDGKDRAVSIGVTVAMGDRWRSNLLLDPSRAEVRDLLMRSLSLPEWMRDGQKLSPWCSAGIIACSAAWASPEYADVEGGGVSRLLPAWERRTRGGDEWSRPGDGDQVVVWTYLAAREGGRVNEVRRGNPKTIEAGRAEADAYALSQGNAIMVDADTMALPWPGGPRIWRRS